MQPFLQNFRLPDYFAGQSNMVVYVVSTDKQTLKQWLMIVFILNGVADCFFFGVNTFTETILSNFWKFTDENLFLDIGFAEINAMGLSFKATKFHVAGLRLSIPILLG